MESQWINNRKNDSFYNLAITASNCGQSPKSLKFYRFDDGAINTLDKNLAKEWIAKGLNFKDAIEVPCRDLKEIGKLILSIEPGFSPAFLNIDIEQVDYLNDLP